MTAARSPSIRASGRSPSREVGDSTFVYTSRGLQCVVAGFVGIRGRALTGCSPEVPKVPVISGQFIGGNTGKIAGGFVQNPPVQNPPVQNSLVQNSRRVLTP